MKGTHVCAAQTIYYFFIKLKIELDFPCLADKIAEPRPAKKPRPAKSSITHRVSVSLEAMGKSSLPLAKPW